MTTLVTDNQDPLRDEKERVFTYVKNFLGDGMIDIEADPAHLETALEKALAIYRQRSQASVEESYCFLDLIVDQNEYILPREIQTVREVFRRSIGSRTGGGDGGSLFEPFNLAYTNTYLMSSSSMGGLATYYMFASYQKLVGKMFGSYINYTYHPDTRKLTLMQRPQSTERVLLWVYNIKPDLQLLQGTYSGIWIRDYALAMTKIMIGQAREKFSSIAGPTGGVQLNGQAMKTEGQTQADKLEEELKKGDPSSQGAYTFVVG